MIRNPMLTKLGGNYHQHPQKAKIGKKAQALLEEVMKDIPDGEFMDYHMHVLELGKDNPHIRLNPSILSLRHPMDYFKIKVSG